MCPRYPVIYILILLLLSVVPHGHGYCVRDVAVIKDGSNNTLTKDGINNTLASPNNTFVLGFFTPDGSFNESRYLGIWYRRYPKVVVWVANRENPVPGSGSCLAIRSGSDVVLEKEGHLYWSTNPDMHGRLLRNLQYGNSRDISFPKQQPGSHSSANFSTAPGTLQFSDKGELYFRHRDGATTWSSFEYPTDTFLPGMSSSPGTVNLTSWQAHNNPVPGQFTLTIDDALLTITKGGLDYWKNRDSPSTKIPQALSDILLGYTNNMTMRLVMNFTGQVQFWKLEGEGVWSLVWSAPEDECSVNEACGSFSICNSNSRRLCKCWPGYVPNEPNEWNSGVFSGGCRRISEPCGKGGEGGKSDEFLRLPLMKVEDPLTNSNSDIQDCEARCLEQCYCVAYSCGSVDCTRTDASVEKNCSTWQLPDLPNLQEEYSQGVTIFIRTNPSDIVKTPKDCSPCGSYIVPYPLSSGANCGDSSYFYFRCNTSIGQLDFLSSNGTFKVTGVSPEARRFTIHIGNVNNCDRSRIDSLIPSPKSSSWLFNVTNCSVVNQSFAGVQQIFTEVDMTWSEPLEPVCNTSTDCHKWPHTTCKEGGGGKMRCLCESGFQWDGSNVKCTNVKCRGGSLRDTAKNQKPKFPLRAVVACISSGLAVILLSSIFCIYHIRKRRMAKREGSIEFQGGDTEGIDVPFFDWGSIVAATDSFADVNKLGTGGFGSVYKGKLPDGKEVAVKRLSSVTEQGVEEFKTEVLLIAKLQHRNLVRLLGFCLKADERILLYEYMPNGSLDSCLFDQTCSVFLEWEKRFDIIFGIARGLLYLHQDSRLRIIHRDLKPSNILLDEEMNPKISDFGIARIVGGQETEGSTKRVIGTYGYMSPEYAYEGLFSVKSDVFSFGMVVLETISGRRNSKLFQLEHGLNLQGYAWKLWNEDKGLELMDQAMEQSYNRSQVLKCIHIGLLCVQEDPKDRPTMSAVVLMLGSENASLPPPKQPAFISKKEPSEGASSSSMMDSSFNDILTFSTGGR